MAVFGIFLIIVVDANIADEDAAFLLNINVYFKTSSLNRSPLSTDLISNYNSVRAVVLLSISIGIIDEVLK